MTTSGFKFGELEVQVCRFPLSGESLPTRADLTVNSHEIAVILLYKSWEESASKSLSSALVHPSLPARLAKVSKVGPCEQTKITLDKIVSSQCAAVFRRTIHCETSDLSKGGPA